MSRWEYRFLGCEKFPDALSALEIEQFFTFESVELTEVKRRRGAMNRLARLCLPDNSVQYQRLAYRHFPQEDDENPVRTP